MELIEKSDLLWRQGLSAICLATCLTLDVLTVVILTQVGLVIVGKATSGDTVSILKRINGCADTDDGALSLRACTYATNMDDVQLSLMVQNQPHLIIRMDFSTAECSYRLF